MCFYSLILNAASFFNPSINTLISFVKRIPFKAITLILVFGIHLNRACSDGADKGLPERSNS